MDSDNDGTSTESVCSSIGTVDSSLELTDSSLLSDKESKLFPWPSVDTTTIVEVDFGSLSSSYGPPLFICFYKDVCGNNVSRIGDFYDVPLKEAVKALNAQPSYVQSNNLIVRFDSCREEDIVAIVPILRLILFRCKIGCDTFEWKRCALLMVDYKFAVKVVEVLVEFTDRIAELNIGSVQLIKEQRQRCDVDEEANRILRLLKTWLEVCGRSIRCLRIFAFVRLDFEFSCIVSNCPSLTHLSLARFTDIDYPVFNLIRSFEFNGCGMGYTDQDLTFAKNLVKYFPSVKTVAFREVCFDPVISSVIRHLAQTGQRYNFYQIVSLQQFVTLVKTAFTVRPIKDECVELVNERYGTHLFVYDNHRIFRTPS